MYRAKQAEGSGRTDWMVMGPCSCVGYYDDECGCLRCKGFAVVLIADGLTKAEAQALARDLTNGKVQRPFNPPRMSNQ